MSLADEPIYDVGIIGAGIAGSAIARDAVLRGLKVVLIEKSEPGTGTSSKTSKLIHGGIRYLEISWNNLCHGKLGEAWKNLAFVFVALREAQNLELTAPTLVKRIPILIPVYQEDPRSTFTIYLGAWLYYLLALFSGGRQPQRLSPAKVIQLIPEIRKSGLKGGVMIWDRTTDDAVLVKTIAASAKAKGAQVLTQTLLNTYSFDSEQNIYSLDCTTRNQAFKLRVRALVNATGPWLDRVRASGNEHKRPWILPVAGAHIEVKKFLPVSLLLQARNGRFFFIVNRGAVSRIGTTERYYQNPDNLEVTAEEIQYLLKGVRAYFPDKKIDESSILAQDAGIRPLVSSGNAVHNSVSREHLIRMSPSGMINVLSVKLTDHRRAAEDVVDCVLRRLGKSKRDYKCQTRTEKLSPL